MKFDSLRDFELYAEKIRNWAYISEDLLVKLTHNPDSFASICKDMHDDIISLIRNRYSETIVAPIYYELLANLLEAKNPKKIKEFYTESIVGFQDDLKYNGLCSQAAIYQLKNLSISSHALYDWDPDIKVMESKALDQCENRGLISNDERHLLERMLVTLDVMWTGLCEKIICALSCAEKFLPMPRQVPRRKQYVEDVFLTDAEISIISQFGKYFRKVDDKWVFIKKHGKGYHWAALAYIFSIIHGTDYTKHVSRLQRYFGATWSDDPNETVSEMGSTRVNNWQSRILREYEEIKKQ